MLEYIIPLIASYFNDEWLAFWYWPLFFLAFLVTVPRIIRSLTEG